MSKKDYYTISKNVEKIIQEKHTNFLNQNILKKVISKLKKENYNIYYPYKDSEKLILYVKELPNICLLEIITKEKLEHREIMGSFYNLNIEPEMFGDIVINNGHYYIFVMDYICESFMEEMKKIGNKNVKLEKVSLEKAKEFKRKYEKMEIAVPSLRLDVIVSKIIGKSRNTVKEKFNNNEIILNNEICKKQMYILKIGDIFSIKKQGKYKFESVIKKNKKNNYVLIINKYAC